MKVGIIGTGSMGTNHLRVVNSIPQMNLTCAMDINQKNLDRACENYAIKKFLDYHQMMDEVDAVMISTPTESHFAIAKDFLLNKKHILIEKPITFNTRQADELIDLAQKYSLVVGVGHLERFNPAVEYIEKHVSQPLFVEIQRLGPFSMRSLDIDVIMDLMIHDLDIILHWDHSKITNISGVGVPIISNKIDIANVRLEFESGLIANITASRVSQKKTRKLRIFQKSQYISVDYKKRRVKMFQLVDGRIIEKNPEIGPVEPLYNLWTNFLRSIEDGKNYNVTAQDGRNALEVATRIRENIKNRFEF